MSRASDALRDATELGRRSRQCVVVWSASDFGSTRSFQAIAPDCACGCRRKVRGEIVTFDGKLYVKGHEATLTGVNE